MYASNKVGDKPWSQKELHKLEESGQDFTQGFEQQQSRER